MEILNRLNSFPRGTRNLFCKTVIRRNAKEWCLMNRREGGWASYAYAYPTLKSLFAAWNAYVVGFGQDDCSFYYEVETAEPLTHARP